MAAGQMRTNLEDAQPRTRFRPFLKGPLFRRIARPLRRRPRLPVHLSAPTRRQRDRAQGKTSRKAIPPSFRPRRLQAPRPQQREPSPAPSLSLNLPLRLHLHLPPLQHSKTPSLQYSPPHLHHSTPPILHHQPPTTNHQPPTTNHPTTNHKKDPFSSQNSLLPGESTLLVRSISLSKLCCHPPIPSPFIASASAFPPFLPVPVRPSSAQ
jgi:hypothetical protein